MAAKVLVIHSIKNPKEKRSKTIFVTAQGKLLEEAKTDGLSPEDINKLVKTIVSQKKISSSYFVGTLSCLIPQTTVSEKTVKLMLQWIFSNYNSATKKSVTLALQWINELIEFELTSSNVADDFYEMWFLLLKCQHLQYYICRLLLKFTKPSDVSRWRVNQVLKIHATQKNQRFTGALLSLFKLYRPDCTPETVKFVGLPKHRSLFEEVFQSARERLKLHRRRDEIVSCLNWSTQLDEVKKRSLKKRIIPTIDYVSHDYAKYQPTVKPSYPVMEFENIVSLGCYQMSLDYPSNAMSLLHNDAGSLIIAFADSDLQSRLSYSVYHTLHQVFIQKSAVSQEAEVQYLLERLALLQEYVQQGIPVVSRFFARYMLQWDGFEFHKEILHILEWVGFNSYDELEVCILKPLEMLFFSSTPDVKCDILVMFRRMLSNMCVSKLAKSLNRIQNLFIGRTTAWDVVPTVKSFIKFVSRLCVMGISCEDGNYLLLNESIQFFETISKLEDEYNLPLFTAMPPVVFYRSLLSTSPVIVWKVCQLLLRYNKVSVNRVRNMGLGKRFQRTFYLIQHYKTDVTNMLAEGTAFSKRRNGYILKHVPQEMETLVSEYFFADDAFLLQSHIAFSSFFVNSPLAADSGLDFINILQHYWKEIYLLIHEEGRNNSS